jgi:DNA-binding LacI/PurR family transcriptional regulator
MTTTSYDNKEFGRIAIERLYERLTNPAWKPRRVIVPNKLVVGDTTGKLISENKLAVGV